MKTKVLFYIAIAIITVSWGVAAVTGVRFVGAKITSFSANVATNEPTQVEPVAPVQAEIVEVAAVSAVDEGNIIPEVFNPTGEYYLDLEKTPAAFLDISNLELETREYYEENGNYLDRLIVPRGSIFGKNSWKLTRLAVGGREIAFQTDTIDGVSYRFTGKFGGGEYCETSEDAPELQGKLIKIKNGKWAAEMDAEFFMSCGC